jgi:hypothetical protein
MAGGLRLGDTPTKKVAEAETKSAPSVTTLQKGNEEVLETGLLLIFQQFS